MRGGRREWRCRRTFSFGFGGDAREGELGGNRWSAERWRGR